MRSEQGMGMGIGMGDNMTTKGHKWAWGVDGTVFCVNYGAGYMTVC